MGADHSLDSQTLAALGAPAAKNLAASGAAHAPQKAMNLIAAFFLRLVCPFRHKIGCNDDDLSCHIAPKHARVAYLDQRVKKTCFRNGIKSKKSLDSSVEIRICA